MRLDDQEQSSNVEDRRGGPGGFGQRPVRMRGKLSIGTVVVALAAWYFFDINPLTFFDGDLTGLSSQEAQVSTHGSHGQLSDAEGVFVSKVLKTTETVWSQNFAKNNFGPYVNPKLVLYEGTTSTACGIGQAATGPFYCPSDRKVYLDLEFFRATGRQMGVNGDFAQGYVIAHEVGHHVQNLLGIFDQANKMMQSGNRRRANAVSVRLELQADCFAGIWAYQLRQQGNVIEEGDINDALHAAAAVGDDQIQKAVQGYVVPDSFTHGSAEQRVTWFKRGLNSGNITQCNTFAQ